MEKKEVKDWGEREMLDFLKKERLEKWKELFQEKNVTGVDLQNLDRLEEIGIKKRGDRLTISNAVIKFLGKKSPNKVLNDPIHGLMEFHPLLIKIMDTPQFQRLRHIKQLGGAYFVYPGASHNRFEHSVGVAHLAGELAKALSSKQPELGISERDILCVQIAGLCHDLGHGPFSHLYDGIFIPKACGETQWKHEDASLAMFDHLVKENGLKPLMELYGLEFPKSGEKTNPEEAKENDLLFIREMIQGKPIPDETKRVQGETGRAQDETSRKYEGRKEEKSFLYEIVANKLNGIDVDKFDYLARDAYHLGMQSNFDHKRFIMLARVCEVEEEREETNKPEEPKKPEGPGEHEETEKPKKTKKHICSRDKEVGNLYDMFHTRYCLHRRVCQHKTHKAIEIMISDAFLKADKHIKIKGSGGKECKLSTAKDDMVAYAKLTDQVFETILHHSSSSPELEEAIKILDPLSSSSSELREVSKILQPLLFSPELEEARKILKRIVSRDLYKFVGEAKQKTDDSKTEVAQNQAEDENKADCIEDTKQGKTKMAEITKEKTDNLKASLAQDLSLDADNFEVPIVTFDYGKKEEDPINHTYFYSKDDNTRGFKLSKNQKSKLLPAHFSEKMIRVYCKNAKNVKLDEVRKAFKKWCSNNDFVVLEDADKAVQE